MIENLFATFLFVISEEPSINQKEVFDAILENKFRDEGPQKILKK
jgi:hypothetical protein